MGSVATIDTRPQIVDITHYGGDTLTIKVTAPESITTGMVWSAQVRANRDTGTPVDATFVITPPVPGGDTAAYVMLKASDCRRLIGTGAVVRKRTTVGTLATVQSYVGVYDVQINHPTNPDPVTTLVQGSLTLDMDVTRAAA
jgi:hypothetical protein